MPIETTSRPGARRSGTLRGFEGKVDEVPEPVLQTGIEAVEDLHAGHGPEPGQLALRELPGREDPAIAQPGLRQLSFEKLPGLPIADAAHRRQRRRQAVAPAQRAQLV